jgi:hypothetical protein
MKQIQIKFYQNLTKTAFRKSRAKKRIRKAGFRKKPRQKF